MTEIGLSLRKGAITDGTIKMREFNTLDEGFAACSEIGHTFPFVVRNCQSFSPSSIQELRSQMKRERDLRGYSSGVAYHLSGVDALQAWDNCSLQFNIIDSESTRGHTNFLPKTLEEFNIVGDLDELLWLSYVLSPANVKCGELHTDPSYGSGWQYLMQGQKRWFVVQDEGFSLSDFNLLNQMLPVVDAVKVEIGEESVQLEPLMSPLLARPAPDMLLLSLQYAVHTTLLGPGDFISFPSGAPHAVITMEASIGVAGYTSGPANATNNIGAAI
jgi:hypothetical protein